MEAFHFLILREEMLCDISFGGGLGVGGVGLRVSRERSKHAHLSLNCNNR